MPSRFKCMVTVTSYYEVEEEAENSYEARHLAHEGYMEGEWKGDVVNVVAITKLKEEKHEQNQDNH